MQTLDGIVVNGGIVLQPPQTLADGVRVKVTVIESATAEMLAVVDEIAERGKEHRRLHGGRTKEEIDADLAAMRQEDDEIERIFAEMRSFMVDVPDFDDRRETIYSPIDGE